MGEYDAIIINDQYVILIAITVIFSLIAIYRRTPLASFIASMCWIICSISHLLASPSNSPLVSVAFLYVVFVFLFLILSIADLISYLDYRKAQKGAVI